MIDLKERAKTLPQSPGVYLFKNAEGVVIYVGKAKHLRARVLQYFGHDQRPQLPFLMADATDLDYIVVRTELESLFLENTLIKQYLPLYNIKMRDDKNYAFISIDYRTEIPTIGYVRKLEDPAPSSLIQGKDNAGQVRYFGPYSSAWKIKQVLNFIRTLFPYCSHEKVGKRPCFYYHLHRCPGVCIGMVSIEEYKAYLQKIILFLAGRTSEVTKELKAQMQDAALHKRYEQAAKLRDSLRNLEMLGVKQLAAFPKMVNWDFVSVAELGRNACVNLFKVREGKLIDKDSYLFDTYPMRAVATDDDTATLREVIQRFCEQYYSDASDLPQEVFCQMMPPNTSALKELLKQRGKRVIDVTVPERGEKLSLIRLGETNAQEALQKWHDSQANNRAALHQALQHLQDILKLPTFPHRIECYDMSNTQGTNPVGSMVVFEDGLPAKGQYRKFKIRVKETPDDFAMMKETLTRRLTRATTPAHEGKTADQANQQLEKTVEEGQSPVSDISNPPLQPPLPPSFGRPSSSLSDLGAEDTTGSQNRNEWLVPDLLVIDGGKGQLGVAVDVLKELQLDIPVIGLAKRIEEIFLPHNPEPIVLPHDNATLQLLQRLRDEAHRFGITFHRSLRSKQAVKSALDEISGIGPKTKKLLKQKFGTVANIKKATMGELAAVVGKQKAELLQKALG